MQKLIIWGAGGHGKVILDIARATGLFTETVFVDDACSYSGQSFCDCELFRSSEGIKSLSVRGHFSFVVAIGTTASGSAVFDKASSKGWTPLP